MMNTPSVLRLCMCLLTCVGCGLSAVTEDARGGSRCLALSEPGRSGLSVALPSRVSWLFRVDTCNGEPVAGLPSSQFEIYEDGKKVSAFESQQRIAAKGERFRLYSVVLLDMSGSLLRSGDFPALAAAAGQYLNTVLQSNSDGHFVQLMTFDGRSSPQVVVPFSSDLAVLRAGLDSLQTVECSTSRECSGFADRKTCAGSRCVDDSTNLNGAVVQSLAVLQDALNSSGVEWRDGALVLFTDGTDQAARVRNEEVLEAIRRTTLHSFTVGLGGEVDTAILTALGRDGAWPVAKAEQLSGAFADIAKRVAGLANRFYALEYCSPKRQGKHELQVVATFDSLTEGRLTGKISGSFDATNFTSGCELR